MSDLAIPSKVLDQHLVALGKTGAGKSSVLRHIVEHFLHHKKRVCVIDPKGDWWGVKLSGDGKSVGYPVVTFGDFKEPKATDIPINDRSGKHVAELIVSGNRPCIIGCRGWMPSAQGRFWIDFASTIFNSNQAGGLNLIIDEIQNYAPKERAGFGEENMALYWMKKILSEGRGLGITVFCGSQRPQSVHNGVLTQCETLVGMRLTHDADCSAVENWLKRTRDKEKREEVLISIPEMPRGEAWVWSPEIGFGPERVKFPMFKTFDSFAPPQQQKKVALSDWSSVDLDEVKSKLAVVVEEAKANDPAELKRTIADLKRKLSEVERSAPKVERKIVEVPILDDEAKRLLEKVDSACNEVEVQTDKQRLQFLELTKQVNTLRAEIQMAVGRHIVDFNHPQTKRSLSEAIRTPVKFQTDPAPSRNGVISGGGVRRMMIALAQRPGLTKKQLGVRAGLSSGSGTFGTYLANLRSAGHITANEPFALTEAGLEALGQHEPLPTGRDLLRYWLNYLGQSGANRMLTALADAYPDTLTREELGARAGISPTSGTFGTYISKLRTLELTDGNDLRANPEFFE